MTSDRPRIAPFAMALLAGAALCGAARAETSLQILDSLQPHRADAARLSIAPSGPRVTPTPPSAVEAAVLPRRSIDRPLGSGRVTGSAGFLCGRQPGVKDSGAASAAGYDPHGRFLGAKLSFAFR
jgi:hypothetical protein